ncbi:recombinase family protein [Sphingomonas adhaesiva]|uniref:recombinase family protein n=1 Tax=Sphingomonas adhaesiva TaxID=28212 RepID=UPI002FFD428B
MRRCAIYARFSTDKQSATSAEDQVAACTLRAEREGWDVAAVYTDVAISGASNRRPGMTQMLQDAASGSFDIVLAEAIDRIARNQADIATIYQRLEFAGVEIVTLTEGAVNELHIGLKGTMSALFLKDLADKIRRGQRGTVARGRVPGGLTYGYEVVSRIGPDNQLVRGLRTVKAEEAAIVRRVYAEYLGGSSPKMIAHRLNIEGVPSPRGGEWRASSIQGSRSRMLGLLYNPVYAGRYAYNRVRMVRDPDTRKRLSRVNGATDLVMVDMPELRIVDDATWQAVQDEAERRAAGPMNQQRRPKHLLSGLLACGRCGGSMVMVRTARIGCTRHREAGTCDVSGSIRRDELETRVLGGITEQLLSPDAISLLVRSYHEDIERRRETDGAAGDAIEARIRKLDAAIGRLVNAIAEGGADFLDIREALAARKIERDQLDRQLREARAVPIIALNPRIVEAYRARVRKLAANVHGTTAENREVMEQLRSIIERVTLTPRNAGAWEIEVHSSLGAVVDMGVSRAAGATPVKKLVAEEGLEPPTPGL